jgi:hypothetical protein
MKLVEPLFSDLELQDLAMSARSLARTKRHDATAQTGSSVASLAALEAKRLDELASKCDRMRKHAGKARPGTSHACDRKGASVEVAMEAPTCSVCGVPQVLD